MAKLKIRNKNKKQHAKTKLGKPPGTLVYTGEKSEQKIRIVLTEYSDNVFERNEFETFGEVAAKLKNADEHTVKWINFLGVHDTEMISEAGKFFNLHPLVVEDVLNAGQRSKIDFYDDYIFVTAKNFDFEKDNGLVLRADHISIVLKEKTVISFQDSYKDNFPEVYKRIETGTGVFRKSVADYLFYVLLDYIVDGYFVITEEFTGKIEDLQDDMIFNPQEDDLQRIQALKKDIHSVRLSVQPVREIVQSLLKADNPLITENARVYLSDTFDHQLHITEMLESYRDSVTSLLDTYLSSLSNRMNEVMKVLTIIATIFIPLTFVAGVYGMNFQNMPELEWKYGYPAVMLLMFLIGIALVFFFKKKKWL